MGPNLILKPNFCGNNNNTFRFKRLLDQVNSNISNLPNQLDLPFKDHSKE